MWRSSVTGCSLAEGKGGRSDTQSTPTLSSTSQPTMTRLCMCEFAPASRGTRRNTWLFCCSRQKLIATIRLAIFSPTHTYTASRLNHFTKVVFILLSQQTYSRVKLRLSPWNDLITAWLSVEFIMQHLWWSPSCSASLLPSFNDLYIPYAADFSLLSLRGGLYWWLNSASWLTLIMKQSYYQQ